MQAKVYHGLTNRWVFWTTAGVMNQKQAEFVANEYAERYGLGDPLKVLSYVNLKQSFAPIDQSGDPRLPDNATGFVEIQWRTPDNPTDLQVSQQPWPNELWVVRKPIGSLPKAPSREDGLYAEDVVDAVGKASDTLSSLGNFAETIAYLGFGTALIWFLMSAKKK